MSFFSLFINGKIHLIHVEMLINRASLVQITRGKIIIQQVPWQPHYAANLIIIYLTEKKMNVNLKLFFSGICDVNCVRVLLIINHTIIVTNKSSIYSIRIVFLDWKVPESQYTKKKIWKVEVKAVLWLYLKTSFKRSSLTFLLATEFLKFLNHLGLLSTFLI